MWELVITLLLGSLLFGAVMGGWILSGGRSRPRNRH